MSLPYPNHPTDLISRLRIYVCGPMTGFPDLNRSAFRKARAELQSRGWNAIVPFEMDEKKQDRPYKEYIAHDVMLLLSGKVDAIFCMKHYRCSNGALLEQMLAWSLGLEVWEEDKGKWMEPKNQWEHLKPRSAAQLIRNYGEHIGRLEDQFAQPPRAKEPETVLEEAQRLVHGDRGQAYGHPLDDFGRTAGMLNSLFKHKLKESLTEEDVATIMCAVKLSRDQNKPTRDNLVDLAGYAECKQMVRDERKKRAEF